MSEKKYFLINQINVNAIFSIVGSYGKPFLRVKGGLPICPMENLQR